MSSLKGKKTRPLGAVRKASITNDTIPSLARMSAEKRPEPVARVEPLSKNYEGISGNAMAVPPAPEKKEEKKLSARSKESEHSSSSVHSRTCSPCAAEKDLKECRAREQSLKHQIEDLQALIEQLRAQLKDKDKAIAGLEEKLNKQIESLQSQLEAEKKSHQHTRIDLEKTKAELDKMRSTVDKLNKEHEEKIQLVRAEIDQKVAEVAAAKDKEIADRDEKLNRLKKQMAEALKGNSWERQQQLEELTKELSRIQEEADLLRMKLKAYSRQKQGHCANCDDLKRKLDKSQAAVQERDTTIRDLKSLCAKFEQQLTQQDELLKMWTEKGAKLIPPK